MEVRNHQAQRFWWKKPAMISWAIALLLCLQALQPASVLGQGASMEYGVSLVVGLHEPVTLSFVIRNPGTSEVEALLGEVWGPKEAGTFVIEIIRPDGTVVTAQPGPPDGFDEFRRPRRVAPRSNYAGELLLNDWEAFATQGNYRITVRLTGAVRMGGREVSLPGSAAELTVQVGPRNEAALRERCASLVSIVRQSGIAALRYKAARAVSAVNDPVAAPYLAEIVNSEEATSEAFARLVDINTAEARLIVATFVQDGRPYISSLARQYLARMKGRSLHTQTHPACPALSQPSTSECVGNKRGKKTSAAETR